MVNFIVVFLNSKDFVRFVKEKKNLFLQNKIA